MQGGAESTFESLSECEQRRHIVELFGQFASRFVRVYELLDRAVKIESRLGGAWCPDDQLALVLRYANRSNGFVEETELCEDMTLDVGFLREYVQKFFDEARDELQTIHDSVGSVCLMASSLCGDTLDPGSTPSTDGSAAGASPATHGVTF